MTPDLVRFIAHSRQSLRTFTIPQLYHLALALRHELAARSLDCQPEADALVAALLAEARIVHAAIFSADCRPAD